MNRKAFGTSFLYWVDFKRNNGQILTTFTAAVAKYVICTLWIRFLFFFLEKICHFIDGLQHSPFYRWKSRCCFFFNDSYTNHYFMRIMFSLWGQSTWSIYQIQGSQIYILQHNVYSSTGSATHLLAIIIFWKQYKTEDFKNM